MSKARAPCAPPRLADAVRFCAITLARNNAFMQSYHATSYSIDTAEMNNNTKERTPPRILNTTPTKSPIIHHRSDSAPDTQHGAPHVLVEFMGHANEGSVDNVEFLVPTSQETLEQMLEKSVKERQLDPRRVRVRSLHNLFSFSNLRAGFSPEQSNAVTATRQRALSHRSEDIHTRR